MSGEIGLERLIKLTQDNEAICRVPEPPHRIESSGAAIMRNGGNVLYLAKKEQCLALGTQFRALFKINDYKIYRIFPNSEVQYLHPKDGVFPEKLNEGRVGVGNIGHSIGKNPQPVNVKFTAKRTYD